MESLHHRFELVDLLAVSATGVPDVGGEEGQAVVAPVVGQALVYEMLVGDELVDRHQLDGGHPEGEEVVDHRVGGEAEVGAPEVLGDPGVGHCHAPDVALVDDGAIPGGSGFGVVAPGEGLVHDHRLGHPRGRVPVVEDEVVFGSRQVVAEELVAPANGSADRFGVGVDEELGPVEAVPLFGVPWSVDPVAVEAARSGVGQVTVRHPVGGDRHGDALQRHGVVGMLEDAELDCGGMLGEECEVDALPVPGGSQRVGRPRPDPHVHGWAPSSCRSSTTARGGAEMLTEWVWPPHGTGRASTSPRFPVPLPP